MMTLSLPIADLRASLLRELRRLDAIAHVAVSIVDGELYARAGQCKWTPVDADLVEVLRRLPSGAGPDAVGAVLT